MKTIIALTISVLLLGCVASGPKRIAQGSLFVGIDVSGSFYNSGYYEETLEFLSYYLYGHLNELGELKPLKALFVGSIGGEFSDETKSFRPIHDFSGKSIPQIQGSLKEWFPKSDKLTDFNVFFEQVASIAKKRNLALSPITIVLLTDGKPDFPGKKGDTFTNIDLSKLEYLSRRVTVRLLYAGPVVANKWETIVPRKRVRMWTVDSDVMAGWKDQLEVNIKPERQTKLWQWIKDNVDFRVRRGFGIRK